MTSRSSVSNGETKLTLSSKSNPSDPSATTDGGGAITNTVDVGSTSTDLWTMAGGHSLAVVSSTVHAPRKRMVRYSPLESRTRTMPLISRSRLSQNRTTLGEWGGGVGACVCVSVRGCEGAVAGRRTGGRGRGQRARRTYI